MLNYCGILNGVHRRCFVRKIIIDKEYLEEMYCNRGMTLLQIANDLGVSRQTVSNKMGELGITIKNTAFIRANKSKPKLVKITNYRSRNEFQKAYSKLKSLDLVAKHFNIDLKTASNWKKRHNIQTIRQFSNVGKYLRNHNKPYMDKKWLEEMYSKYSWEDLGKILNCSPTTLSKWGRKFRIKTRTVSEQWSLKSKNGGYGVVKENIGFDLQLYKKTYAVGRNNVRIPSRLKNYIISLYGKCECCGYSEVLDLHHIDGDHNNNEPSNHGVLCPNCHAKIHRLGIPFSDLVPNHISWDFLIDNE